MRRRKFIKTSLGATLAATTATAFGKGTQIESNSIKVQTKETRDVTVIGAGVFGVWTAFYLQELGAKVTLVDAFGPGNSRASSGGESRILRADYGDRLMYTRMNIRAYELWQQWQREWACEFMYPTGRLTLGDDAYLAKARAAKKRLSAFDIEGEILNVEELKYRWPQINYEGLEGGLYFPGGAGGSTLMAREACRIVGEQFVKKGGTLKIAKAMPGKANAGMLQNITLNEKELQTSGTYIFACGPWMGKLFPGIFATQLSVVRRDVLFVGSVPGDDRYTYPNFPVWIFANKEDSRYYGMPDIRGRGLKVAPWPDNNSIDMDEDDRFINPYEVKRTRAFLAKRFPGLKDQPILEDRVCQLTFSSDEHFIVDQHPQIKNVWFLCAGSGHGFKHGPALGEYVANRILLDKKVSELDEVFRLNKQ